MLDADALSGFEANPEALFDAITDTESSAVVFTNLDMEKSEPPAYDGRCFLFRSAYNC